MNQTHSYDLTPCGPPRKHVCAVFRNDADRMSTVVPFFVDGLRRNDRCVYISDRVEKEDLIDALCDACPIEPSALETRLVFLSANEAYLRDGEFDKARTATLIADMRDQALKEGFLGITLSGEMSWASKDAPGSSDLLEYEASVNYMFPSSSADLLCQYTESDFDTSTLVGAVRAHPKVIVRGTVCGNPYYLPPEVYMKHAAGVTTSEVLDLMEREMFGRAVLSEMGSMESRELKRARQCLKVFDEMLLDDLKDRLSAASFLHELALSVGADEVAMSHIRAADAKCRELVERLEAVRAFRSCMDAPSEWQSLEDLLSKGIEAAGMSTSGNVLFDVDPVRIYASTSLYKAFGAIVAAASERARAGAKLAVCAKPSGFGVLITVTAEGQGVPEGAKRALFDQTGPCLCGRSLCLSRELMEANGITVREIGVPGRSTVFEVHVPASRVEGM